MNYLRQILRAVDHIEEHLDEPFDLTEVSRVAGVSHWHFLRMFKALTGETLKGYVRARRLAEARVALLTTPRSVLEIALRAGFESQASFTRAFQKAFGMPPARYRTLGSQHVHVDKLRLDEEFLRHLDSNLSLKPAIVSLPERTMMGLTTQFYSVDSERNNIGEKLPALWDAFLPRLPEVAGAIAGVCYGVVEQAGDEDELLAYMAGIEVPSVPGTVPEGMECKTIPAATYATFEHRGFPREIDLTVNFVYSSWLLNSGYQHSYGPDLEVYDERWAPDSAASVMGYAIPIRA